MNIKEAVFENFGVLRILETDAKEFDASQISLLKKLHE